MRKNHNILIVSPHKVALTETFINSHIERLDANKFYLYGYDLNYRDGNDKSLADFYKDKPNFFSRFKSLLPHYLYYKLEQHRKRQNSNENLISRYIRENKIDLVLAEYGIAGSYIAPICKVLNIPLLVHFHGYDASRYDILESYKTGYQLMFQTAQRIIVVSKAMAKALESLGCPKNKLVLNTYGPHPDFTKTTVNYGSNYLISVGRQTFKKAPYLLLLAFKKVIGQNPELRLKIIGDGELYGITKNMIKSLGLEKQVFLLGGLERPEIIKQMKTAFVFVQHSIVAHNGDSEGTPVGIIEAMAAGLPVVSTKHAGIPDVVKHKNTGYLVEENDVNEMAKYMLDLSRDRDLVEKMGQRGKEFINSNFTMDGHIETLNSTINDILVNT